MRRGGEIVEPERGRNMLGFVGSLQMAVWAVVTLVALFHEAPPAARERIVEALRTRSFTVDRAVEIASLVTAPAPRVQRPVGPFHTEAASRSR